MNTRHVIAAAALLLAATGCGVAVAETTPLRAPAGPDGLVIAHEPGAIIVVPWRRGRAERVLVSEQQARACAVGDLYKVCLEARG
ncbi:hypothetical protein [Nonomuraea sp. bgisy101]|uniref:hypothetical protein n=1 Tax=Nonomuraea sp. bgisy101 TaxID=3413784 RepID=UPI003D742D41